MGARALVQANDTKFTTFISDFTISPALARCEQMKLQIPDTGVELPVEVVSGKILNRRGEPLAIVSVLHDLTEQVENERLYEELKRFSSQREERIRAATADSPEQNTRLPMAVPEARRRTDSRRNSSPACRTELRTRSTRSWHASLMLDRIYGDSLRARKRGSNAFRARPSTC